MALKWIHPILAILPTLLTAVVGFASAWVLFVLTERRKASQAQRELRRALVAELENVEVMLSAIVAKYARYCENDEQVVLVAAEIRWFSTIGRRRMVEAGVLSPLPVPDTKQPLAKLGDQDLVKLYSGVDETQGTRIIVPVVDSLLSGRTSGFSASQIQSLVSVRWHTHLIAQDADAMDDLLRLTFTVNDEINHPIVLVNHRKRSISYAQRAQVLLGAVRTALTRFEDS